MVTENEPLHVGSRVVVPWGHTRTVGGTVVDVWGDPPDYVRVQLDTEADEDPYILLLLPEWVTAA